MGTTGFLVLIAVFLALNLEDDSTLSKDVDAPGLREEELIELAAETARMNDEVKALQKLPQEDEATLRRSIEALKASVLRLTATSTEELPAAPQAPDREVQIEVEKLLTKIENLKREQEEATRRVADVTTSMTETETQVKDAEARLLQSRDKGNVLRLIPERSDTTKEPVLVLVQQPPWIIQRFDGGAARTAYSIPEMLEVLSPLSPATHYVVFYFKPSGSKHFEGVTNRVRLAGYEIGYDLIPENLQLEFGGEKN